MIFEGDAFAGVIGHENGALMNGTSALIYRGGDLGSLSLLSAMWGDLEKMAIYKPGSSSSPDPDLGPWTWTSSLQDHEKEMLVYKSPCVW